ncbi:MAG: hypothetical protein J5965_06395, partial [Aeriscardovia sp.]|nr:hypothetical protein [Aeriscardovia sp.]
RRSNKFNCLKRRRFGPYGTIRRRSGISLLWMYVQVLTDSSDVKQYIKKMRSRDPELNASWGTICTLTRMMASDGKFYKTQAATTEGIFRLIQSIPSPKAEPFKQWMAAVAS